jgi:hypothetical protein
MNFGTDRHAPIPPFSDLGAGGQEFGRSAEVLWRMYPSADSKAHETARRYTEFGARAVRTSDYRGGSSHFFWGRPAGFRVPPWALAPIRPTGSAMTHTRLEDLKQRRLDRMTASEREEREAAYSAAGAVLTEADPDSGDQSPDPRG